VKSEKFASASVLQLTKLRFEGFKVTFWRLQSYVLTAARVHFV